jgi:hypothetical protein
MTDVTSGKPRYLVARKGNSNAVQDYLNEKAREGYHLAQLIPVYAKVVGQAADVEFFVVVELEGSGSGSAR